MKNGLTAVLFCALELSGISVAQSSPEAKQLLQRAVARTHGSSAVTAVEAHGTIRYLLPDAEKSGPVTLSLTSEGTVFFRTSVAGHDRTIEVSGATANVTENGKSSQLPLTSIERLRFIAAPYILPAFVVSHAWTFDGRIAVGSLPGFRISTALVRASLLFDSNDLKIISAELDPPNHRTASSRFVFGDYRETNGIWLPWAVAEQVGNQTTWRIEFDSVMVSTSGSTK